jgi:hypothetical protein
MMARVARAPNTASAFAFLFIFGSTGTETDAPLKTDERDALPAEPFSVRAWLRGKWTASKRPSFAFRARPAPALVFLQFEAEIQRCRWLKRGIRGFQRRRRRRGGVECGSRQGSIGRRLCCRKKGRRGATSI